MTKKPAPDTSPNRIKRAVRQANRLLSAGKLHAALDEANRIVKTYPESGICHRLLGVALLELGKKQAAIACFQRALELDPSDASLRMVARGLIENDQFDQALNVLTKIREPEESVSQALWIQALAGAGKHDEAEAATVKALDEERESPSLLITVAHFGLALDYPELVPRLTRIVELKDNSPGLKAKLSFCIGDLLHQKGKHADAFRAFGHANRLARLASHQPAFDPAAYRKRMHSVSAHFPLQGLKQDPPIAPNDGMRRLLMIIGAPRSGKTLLESLLTRHPAIQAGREQVPFETLLSQIEQQSSRDRNQLLAKLPLATRLKSASPYQRTLQQQGRGARFVTDTNPSNLAALGFMWASIPDSRFIFVDRGPLDLAFSNYATHMPYMATGQLTLEHLGIYLGEVRRLMAFWRDAFAERAMWLSYEALVGNETESVIQECLTFLGLDWHPDCAVGDQTLRQTTVSADAVAGHRPDDRFVGVSEPYHQWLMPMKENMEAVLSDAGKDH